MFVCRLGSHICGCKCFQIELCRGYDYASFHDDLKKLYDSAGVQNQDTVFLFTDTQVSGCYLFTDTQVSGYYLFTNTQVSGYYLFTDTQVSGYNLFTDTQVQLQSVTC